MTKPKNNEKGARDEREKRNKSQKNSDAPALLLQATSTVHSFSSHEISDVEILSNL